VPGFRLAGGQTDSDKTRLPSQHAMVILSSDYISATEIHISNPNQLINVPSTISWSTKLIIIHIQNATRYTHLSDEKKISGRVSHDSNGQLGEGVFRRYIYMYVRKMKYS